MALAVRDKAGQDAKVVSFGLWKPSMFYYLDRDIPRIRSNDKEALAQTLAKPEPVMVLTRAGLPVLEQVAGVQYIQQYQGYLLAGNRAANELWLAKAQDKAQSQPAARPQDRNEMPGAGNEASGPANAREKQGGGNADPASAYGQEKREGVNGGASAPAKVQKGQE
jgi:hypothetical protein